MPNCFPKRLYHVTSPHAVDSGSNFFTSLPTLAIIYLFNYSHPSTSEVYFMVVLICIFLMVNNFQHLGSSFCPQFLASCSNKTTFLNQKQTNKQNNKKTTFGIFSHANWQLIQLLHRNVNSVPLPIFKLGCLFILQLYLEYIKNLTSPFWNIWFAYIFSHCEFLFHFVDGVLWKTESFNLDEMKFILFLLLLLVPLESNLRIDCLIQGYKILLLELFTLRE